MKIPLVFAEPIRLCQDLKGPAGLTEAQIRQIVADRVVSAAAANEAWATIIGAKAALTKAIQEMESRHVAPVAKVLRKIEQILAA